MSLYCTKKKKKKECVSQFPNPKYITDLATTTKLSILKMDYSYENFSKFLPYVCHNPWSPMPIDRLASIQYMHIIIWLYIIWSYSLELGSQTTDMSSWFSSTIFLMPTLYLIMSTNFVQGVGNIFKMSQSINKVMCQNSILVLFYTVLAYK
jgi:hypothetical protein